MEETKLYTIRNDVECLNCGNVGAIQYYGDWYPSGLGSKVDGIKSYEKYRDKPYMSYTMGFGGTIPHECMNCKSYGLIDFGGLEGYKMAFRMIKEATK